MALFNKAGLATGVSGVEFQMSRRLPELLLFTNNNDLICCSNNFLFLQLLGCGNWCNLRVRCHVAEN
jgi:hypothetical protein